jgi:acetylornithine deacetylase
MKGFIAATLALAPRFAEAELARPLHFAFTYDEEIGCFGARVLMKEIAGAGIRPSVVIIGEPTSMRVIEGHKGCYEYTTEFTGMEGHGSQPDRGVNAIEYAARYISRLLDLRERLKERAPANSRFDPPWTTVQVGAISGGTVRNVIAGSCAVEWEMRPVTGDDAAWVKNDLATYVDNALLPAMRAVSPDCGIVTRTIGEVEGLQVVDESEARDIVCELTGCDHTDVVSFGTEAGLFQAAGISSIICGPGSIAQAHKPDEFIEIGQLAACLEMLDKLRLKLAR